MSDSAYTVDDKYDEPNQNNHFDNRRNSIEYPTNINHNSPPNAPTSIDPSFQSSIQLMATQIQQLSQAQTSMMYSLKNISENQIENNKLKSQMELMKTGKNSQAVGLEKAMEEVQKINNKLSEKYDTEMEKSVQFKKIITDLTTQNEKYQKNEKLQSEEINRLKTQNKELVNQSGDTTKLIDQINEDREAFLIQQSLLQEEFTNVKQQYNKLAKIEESKRIAINIDENNNLTEIPKNVHTVFNKILDRQFEEMFKCIICWDVDSDTHFQLTCCSKMVCLSCFQKSPFQTTCGHCRSSNVSCSRVLKLGTMTKELKSQINVDLNNSFKNVDKRQNDELQKPNKAAGTELEEEREKRRVCEEEYQARIKKLIADLEVVEASFDAYKANEERKKKAYKKKVADEKTELKKQVSNKNATITAQDKEIREKEIKWGLHKKRIISRHNYELSEARRAANIAKNKNNPAYKLADNKRMHVERLETLIERYNHLPNISHFISTNGVFSGGPGSISLFNKTSTAATTTPTTTTLPMMNDESTLKMRLRELEKWKNRAVRNKKLRESAEQREAQLRQKLNEIDEKVSLINEWD